MYIINKDIKVSDLDKVLVYPTITLQCILICFYNVSEYNWFDFFSNF